MPVSRKKARSKQFGFQTGHKASPGGKRTLTNDIETSIETQNNSQPEKNTENESELSKTRSGSQEQPKETKKVPNTS